MLVCQINTRDYALHGAHEEVYLELKCCAGLPQMILMLTINFCATSYIKTDCLSEYMRSSSKKTMLPIQVWCVWGMNGKSPNIFSALKRFYETTQGVYCGMIGMTAGGILPQLMVNLQQQMAALDRTTGSRWMRLYVSFLRVIPHDLRSIIVFLPHYKPLVHFPQHLTSWLLRRWLS